nr:hypothetical protein [Tanacetum cinerariifolium]
ICESNSHYGYECSQRVPLVYEPEPCYTQNFSDNDYSHDLPCVNPLTDHHCCYECGSSLNDFFCPHCTCEFCGNSAHVGYNFPAQVPSFQTLPSFPQQYPCCEDCGVLSEADHCQPPQYTVNHPIFNVHNDILTSQTMIVEQMTQLTSMCEMFCQFVQKKREEKRIEEEQAAKAQNWKLPICYDDEDDEERSNFLQDNIIFGLPPCSAITPNEPADSLSMGDEHLNTIPAMESNEFIKSCVENLVPNPSESEDIRLIEILLYDNSSPRPPEEFVSENSNADIESFSPSPIPNEDSDSHMEEINLSFNLDDLKMMTDKYCPRGKIKKLETDMWELKTKGTDVIESDRVEKYISGLPDMIHDSEAIEFATELMDRKIRTFAKRQIENKRKQDDNNNQAQQQPLKKQSVAIAYTAGPSERKEYAGTLPLCNKCKFHHNGQCTVKCVNCKRVGHLTRDCRSPAATHNHRNPTCYQCRNQGHYRSDCPENPTCYQCRNQGHYRSDCPELKNQDHVNQARGTGAHGMVHALEGGQSN